MYRKRKNKLQLRDELEQLTFRYTEEIWNKTRNSLRALEFFNTVKLLIKGLKMILD
jgi:hypothetical protein